MLARYLIKTTAFIAMLVAALTVLSSTAYAKRPAIKAVKVINAANNPVPTYRSAELVNDSASVGIFGELTRTVPDGVVLTDFWYDDSDGTCRVEIEKADSSGAVLLQMRFLQAGNSVFRSFQSGILSTSDEPVVISFGPSSAAQCFINIGWTGYVAP